MSNPFILGHNIIEAEQLEMGFLGCVVLLFPRMVPQDVVPEMFPQSLEGPALNIRDHLLKWEKSHVQTSQTRLEPVEFRLMFESGVEEEVTSCLPMENCGTTAIYYSWKVYYHTVHVVAISGRIGPPVRRDGVRDRFPSVCY